MCFQSPYIFPRKFFINADPYTSGLLTSTSFGAYISKACYAPRWICIEKSEVPMGRGVGYPLDLEVLDKRGTKFQRLYLHVFGDNESNGTIGTNNRRNRKSEIQDGGLQSGHTHISTCRYDSNEIPTASFGAIRYPTVLLGILSDVTRSQKSKMAASNLEIRISRLR